MREHGLSYREVEHLDPYRKRLILGYRVRWRYLGDDSLGDSDQQQQLEAFVRSRK